MVFPVIMRSYPPDGSHDCSPNHFHPAYILSEQDQLKIDAIIKSSVGDRIMPPKFSSSDLTIPFEAGINSARPISPCSYQEQMERGTCKSLQTGEEGRDECF